MSQNVIVMTYVAMIALCVFVWYVSCHCIILVCMCAMLQQAHRTKAPLRINEVLTPPACQTLLTYTLILEEPYSVQPFFVLHCLRCWSSRLSITLSSILRWVCHGNFLSDRVSAEILLHSTPQCTLECLIAYYSSAFTIPMHSD